MYRKLFSIEIIHAYYSSDEWMDVTIIPDRLTLQFFNNSPFCIRTLKNGVGIFVNADAPSATLAIPDKLTFEVFPTAAIFNQFRDFSELQDNECLLFRNQTSSGDTQLMPAATPAPDRYLNGFQVAALIDIYPGAAMNDLRTDLHYTATFKVQSAIWKYYLITNSDAKDMWIEDTALTPLLFNQVGTSVLLTDPVITGLQSQFPDTTLLTFASDTVVPFQRKGRKNIQLIRKGYILIADLPNPTDPIQPFNILRIF
ncbi:hypothetical protein BW716_08735 [[Flexibacter] sp. ATCC 35208]|nr:hypothetical protein BW716_08735 [[Flexibacter] sp. ATCC 35208]